MNTASLNIIFNDEVVDAISSKKPIVSLESNVLTHGLKYPDNLDVAVDVENNKIRLFIKQNTFIFFKRSLYATY